MADPVSIGLMVASTAFKVVGSIAEGNSASQQANARADAATYAAQGERQQAQNTLMLGDAREDLVRRQNRQFLGSQFASFAQNGIDPSSGSAAAVQSSSAAKAELDALTVRYQADLQASNLKNQATADEFNASAYRESASAARRSGYINAAASIVGSTGNYMRQSALSSKSNPYGYGSYGSNLGLGG